VIASQAALVELVPVGGAGAAHPGGGPLTLLLDAVSSGCRTMPALVARTGLTPDVVRTGLDHLVLSGRLRARALSVGCPAGGCNSCALARGGCRLGCTRG
jgi:hypothetical protein